MTKYINQDELKFGKMGSRVIDITGMKVGESGQVLGYYEKDKWYVQCSCEKIFIATSDKIKGTPSRIPLTGCFTCSRKLDTKTAKLRLLEKEFPYYRIIGDMTPNNLIRKSKYVAVCCCGNFFTITGYNIAENSNCGCITKKLTTNYEDFINKRFGRLTVLYYVGTNVIPDNPHSFFMCECDCGEIKCVPAAGLVNGTSQSCGCLRKERAAKASYWRGKFGKAHCCWKEIKATRRPRHDYFMKLVRDKVFKRDDWTCEKCKIRGGELHLSHIRNYKDYEASQYDPDNCLTMCVKCHYDYHKQQGWRRLDESNMIDYLGYELPCMKNIYDPIYLGM